MKSLDELQQEKLRAEIDKIKEETAQIKKQAEAAATSKKLTDEKTKKETEKLDNDITQSKKPIHRQLPFWTSIFSVLIPVATVIVSFYVSGGQRLFDIKNEELNLQKQRLGDSVAKLKADSQRLYSNFIVDSQRLHSNYDSAKSGLYKNFVIESTTLQKKYSGDSITLQKKYNGDSITLRQKYNNDSGHFAQAIASDSTKLLKLNDELAKSPFYVKLQSIIDRPNAYFEDILKTMKKTPKFKNDYLRKIEYCLDTTENLSLKSSLVLLCYSYTTETRWRDSIIPIANNVYRSVTIEHIPFNKSYARDFFLFICREYGWRSFGDTLFVAKLLLNSVEELKQELKGLETNNSESFDFEYMHPFLDKMRYVTVANKSDFAFILERIINFYKNRANYLREGNNRFLVTTVGEILNSLEEIAPITYSCFTARSFAVKTQISNNSQLNFEKDIIDSNLNILKTGPSNYNSPDSWKIWLQQHQYLLNIIDNIEKYIEDPVAVKSIIGNKGRHSQ